MTDQPVCSLRNIHNILLPCSLNTRICNAEGKSGIRATTRLRILLTVPSPAPPPRKQRLGTFLVELLTVLSQSLGCYKTTLDCKPDVAGYYQKLGYVSEGQLLMSQRHFD